MATYIGIGFSKDLDTLTAAKEAADQAKFNLRCEQIDLAIVLNTIHYNSVDFIPTIFDRLDKTKLIGSSTSGIMLSERIETRGIAVMTIYSEEIRFETGSVDNLNLRDLYTAGVEFAKGSVSGYGQSYRKFFLFFADGLLQEFSRCIDGMSQSLGANFPIIGAGSSDDFHFKKTYQYYNNTVLNAGACGAICGGRLQVGMSCRHGWRPLGKPRSIDEIEGNVIKSIDHKPATNIYQEYFKSESETLKASSLAHLNTRYPLGVSIGKEREYLLRNVIKTLDDDSLVLQDAIPANKDIHLMLGNKDSCLRAAETAALEVKAQLEGKIPRLLFIIEAQSRYRILGRSANAEIQRIREILGYTAPFLGMYSFGEIFTYLFPDGSKTLLQNESIIILAIH